MICVDCWRPVIVLLVGARRACVVCVETERPNDG